LNELSRNGTLTDREIMYGYTAGRFTFYFITQLIEEFEELYKHLAHDTIF
jgi:hypothetical protein